MHALRSLAVLGLVTLMLPRLAAAQCFNTATPTCGVYTQCFAKLCPCEGSTDEYFKTYGEKYCTTFLELPGLSSDGTKWRDSTLRCLQETIVPQLPPFGHEADCNCKATRAAAFKSHVTCYTKPGASICNLGVSDWWKIAGAADVIKNSLDREGRGQMIDVLDVCLKDTSVSDRVKAIMQSTLDSLR